MKLSVPFHSQYDVKDEGWKIRACAPTCLKMVMDFLSEGEFKVSTDELIQEGLTIVGAYIDSIGWVHNGLIRIAHNHGFLAYNEEFRSRNTEIEKEFVEKGIEKIRKTIEAGLPVIISCSKNFDEFHKPHQVVIVGIEKGFGSIKGFYYHEPEARDEESGSNRFVDIETFKTHWRKFAIFVSK